ncbi:hypothetical protein RND81_13G098300 [Saponaria officinalis]|uniref:Aminotransferase-like plant mobile domain-containing protein n=1 Tax=Saponaria officinalis TaxID=3572 RepID=A0AAW1GVZ6_SAPOF
MGKSVQKVPPTMKKDKGKQLMILSDNPGRSTIKSSKVGAKKQPLKVRTDCLGKAVDSVSPTNAEKPSSSPNPVDNDGPSEHNLKCRPLNLVELILGLTNQQKAAVEEIGFGGLLQLKVRRVPKKIVPMLLSSFNDGSFMFHTSTCNFLLRKEDVHDCFLLPMGPRKVPLLGTGRSKNTSQDSSRELKESWREKFGVGGSSNAILIGKLYSELLKSKAGDEDFKRMFVLYSMSAFLAPTTNSTVDLKLLLAVDDVSQIGQLDWCSYVFKNVVKACIDSKKNPAFVGGCIVFLMIAYFHRFNFQGESSPTTLPLIQHWDYDTLKQRAAAEMKCGVLGNAVPSTTHYPICIQSKSSEVGNEDSIKLIELFNRKRKFDQNTKEKPEKIKYKRLDTPSGVLHHDETTDSAAENDATFNGGVRRQRERWMCRR